jgi:hypothetical protein
MMDALLPIPSLPERVGGRNLLWRRLLIKIIRLGEDERGYARQPQASVWPGTSSSLWLTAPDV